MKIHELCQQKFKEALERRELILKSEYADWYNVNPDHDNERDSHESLDQEDDCMKAVATILHSLLKIDPELFREQCLANTMQILEQLLNPNSN